MNNHDDGHFECDATVAAEIEQLESWLADVSKQFPEPPCNVIEHVKMRTSVAVGEQQLVGSMGSPTLVPSAKAMASTKAAVRRELAEVATVANGDRPVAAKGKGMAWGALATFASAAMIALVVIPGVLNSTKPDQENDAVAEVSAVEDWAYVLTAASSGEFDERVAGFKSDIDDLRDTFASSQDFADELGFDDIDDAIDQLYSDSDSLLDS